MEMHKDIILVVIRSNMQKLRKGFTLIEMMLVLVIISSIISMLANYTVLHSAQIIRDRATVQMQQILNAGLAYYINTGTWPNYSTSTFTCPSSALTTLVPTYLPTMVNPYMGQTAYKISCSAGGVLFSVSVGTPSTAEATVLAGMLPMGVATGTSVSASVNVPGQNLNNARSVNQTGIYHNGGCVPVPTCPGATSGTTEMTPSIYVAAAQVSGSNETASSNPKLYPITGFTAYAVGGTNSTPPQCPPNGSSTAACSPPNGVSGQKYWRVCIDVSTVAGDIGTNTIGETWTNSNSWGQYQSVLAETRCVPSSSNEGDVLSVWEP
jgi:prepilin-type N-terminal cleavage/methylation domain-containing protein